mmetsp:Transcript_77701/g.251694  ORF Transcript_77701/g.251694 Transcript_77701/m.251694 type:complete len:220 (+) Transcript_77701:51-710(+)
MLGDRSRGAGSQPQTRAVRSAAPMVCSSRHSACGTLQWCSHWSGSRLSSALSPCSRSSSSCCRPAAPAVAQQPSLIAHIEDLLACQGRPVVGCSGAELAPQTLQRPAPHPRSLRHWRRWSPGRVHRRATPPCWPCSAWVATFSRIRASRSMPGFGRRTRLSSRPWAHSTGMTLPCAHLASATMSRRRPGSLWTRLRIGSTWRPRCLCCRGPSRICPKGR